MNRASGLLCCLLCAPLLAHAVSTADVDTLSCSGSLSASLLESASFACIGDMSVVGGSIESDLMVSLQASGALFLDGLSITAPVVFVSAGSIALGDGSVLITAYDNLTIQAPSASGSGSIDAGRGRVVNTPVETLVRRGGDLVIGSPGSISIGSPGTIVAVPEPDNYLLLAAGLLPLFVLGQKKRA